MAHVRGSLRRLPSGSWEIRLFLGTDDTGKKRYRSKSVKGSKREAERTMRQLIAEIEAMSPEDEFYDAKVKVLGEYIKHHVKEEEQPGGIFSQAKKGDEDLEAMGERLQARKEELMAELAPAKAN